jgi:hypothetical protein
MLIEHNPNLAERTTTSVAHVTPFFPFETSTRRRRAVSTTTSIPKVRSTGKKNESSLLTSTTAPTVAVSPGTTTTSPSIHMHDTDNSSYGGDVAGYDDDDNDVPNTMKSNPTGRPQVISLPLRQLPALPTK